jgi:hypothetical protein
MGDMNPGWYEDRDDPTLARWFDGEGMTQHTLVIADQTPGQTPPPPTTDAWALNPPTARPTPAARPVPPAGVPIADAELSWSPDAIPYESATAVGPTVDPAPRHQARITEPDPDFWDEAEPEHDRRRDWRSLSDRIESIGWGWFALPAAGIALIVAAMIGITILGGGEDPSTVEAGATGTTGDLDAAVAVALEASDVSFFVEQGFEQLLPMTCEAAESGDPDELVDEVAALEYDEAVLLRLLHALHVGAQTLCPSAIGGNPRLLDDVHSAIAAQQPPDFPAPSVSAPAAADASSTSSSSSTSTSTTTRRTTTTRASNPTPTSQAPATTTTTTTSTTVPTVVEGQECGTPGATAATSGGGTLTCVPTDCLAPSSPPFVWGARCPGT